MNFDNQLFRCSSLGHIMSEPKGKSFGQQYSDGFESYSKKLEEYKNLQNKQTKTAIKLLDTCEKLSIKLEKLEPLRFTPNLSDTCKTYLCDLHTVVVNNRTEDIRTKYMEKGLKVEEDVITLYSMLRNEFYVKNKKREENDFITGEMDFCDDTFAIDAKANWSIFQFKRVVAKQIKPLYHWQLDGYMWLFNKERGKLVYGLVNTPDELILAEIAKLKYGFIGSEEDYKNACIEVRRNHEYGDIPAEKKVKIFNVKRNDERIDRLKSRIAECRQYLNTIDNLNSFENDTEEMEDEGQDSQE